MPRLVRGAAAVVSACLLLAAAAAEAANVSIRDVPLTPWTGFAENWDWTYDALHKLVLSGITGPVVLNIKPMSRREMALIIADVVQRIQNNQVSEFDHRYDLQEILLDLMNEFSPELKALGLTGYGINGKAPRLFEINPLNHLQIRGAYASNAATNLANSNGERLDKGLNGRVTGDAWLEAGGVFAAYAQPEYQIGRDTDRGQLIEGYAKARGGPVELVVGRESMWWGPAYHGSMLLSNNALGLDMVRLQTANQLTLPWVFRELGPLKAQLFLGQLESEREFYPRSKITGGRVDLVPLQWLEVGLARTIIFDGTGYPGPAWYDYPRMWFEGNHTGIEPKFQSDNRFELDAAIRLADIGKYLPLTRDAEIYIDGGWDDTCCGSPIIPIKPVATVGLYLPNLFLSPDTTFRFEASSTSDINFTHSVWRDGYERYGQVISTFEGTAGQDLFFRLTHKLDKDLEAGLEVDLARIGATNAGPYNKPIREFSRYVAGDLSYKYSDNLSFRFGTRFEYDENRDFVVGNSGPNFVQTVEATYTFDRSYGAGERATLPPGSLPPLAPPPKSSDPDEILSWRYAGKVIGDGWDIATSPLRWDGKDWLIAGGVAAATGGAMLLDHDIRDFAQDNRSRTGDRVANAWTNFALIAPAVGLVGSYVAGEAFHDQEAKQQAADGLEASILTNAMLVYPMKFLIGRSQPADERGSQDYRPFNISGSMPSFHTAEAFTAAAVIAEHADNPWVSTLVYGLAGGVGAARIYEDKHWASDALLAAAIGTAVGKAVVYLNKERRNSPVSIVPLADGKAWGAALQVKY